MNKIEVAVLNEATDNPAGMQLFLAKFTQRGHAIKNMADLYSEYYKCMNTERSPESIKAMSRMPHGTINRFSPITIAIVGASRRFLTQIRTHQVGLDFVSGSLQYSDYSEASTDQFVVPYALLGNEVSRSMYLQSCNQSMEAYEYIAKDADGDTAGYAAPQGLRNILIMQGNHQSWEYLIRLRSCNRNTPETQYVMLLIWEALLATADGESLFTWAGPDCVHGHCREGRMFCGDFIRNVDTEQCMNSKGISLPRAIIETKYPLLKED